MSGDEQVKASELKSKTPRLQFAYILALMNCVRGDCPRAALAGS